MQTLNVALGDRAYPIHIGRGLLARAELILPHLKTKRVAIFIGPEFGTVQRVDLVAAAKEAADAKRARERKD